LPVSFPLHSTLAAGGLDRTSIFGPQPALARIAAVAHAIVEMDNFIAMPSLHAGPVAERRWGESTPIGSANQDSC
jgi:hypothetical protein